MKLYYAVAILIQWLFASFFGNKYEKAYMGYLWEYHFGFRK
jgi:hypothetical protein